MTSLFSPYQMAGTALANRIVMAPMTRSRNPDLIANALTAQYYAQRASAGLIVTEGTPVTPAGQGYIGVPGIWSAEQASGWKLVTDAVHAEGGRIFAQIWHVGRMSHSSLQPDGGAPVSASAVPVAESPYSFAFITLPDGTPGRAPPTPPRALGTDEVTQLVQTFADAGANAVAAGFDGIEIHAANGYLFEQFLNPNVNQRTDQYGGSRENRLRFTLEVVDALVARIGADKVGIRLAPNGFVFDMQPYDDNAATYLQLARELDARGIAYLHLSDNGTGDGQPHAISNAMLADFRAAFRPTIILAGKMTQARAQQLIDDGLIDLAGFGQPFISNPDLVARLRDGIALTEPDRETYYGGDARGYTDYPTAS
jgi:N-ethylmaleimide reductase